MLTGFCSCLQHATCALPPSPIHPCDPVQAVQSRKSAVLTATDPHQEQQKYRPSRTRDNPLARVLVSVSPTSPSKSGHKRSERSQHQSSAHSSAHDISICTSPPRQSSFRRGRDRERINKSCSLVSACRQMVPDSSMFSSSLDRDNTSSWSHSAPVDEPHLPLRQRYSLPGSLSSSHATANDCIPLAHKPEPSPPKPCENATHRGTRIRRALHSSPREPDPQEAPLDLVASVDSPPSPPVLTQVHRPHCARTADLQRLPPRASRSFNSLGDSAPLPFNTRCDVWSRAHAAGVWHGRALATMSQLTQEWTSLRTVLEMQRPSPSPSPRRGRCGFHRVQDAISMALENLSHSTVLPPLDSASTAPVLTGAAVGVLVDSGMPSSIVPDEGVCSGPLDSGGQGPMRKRSKTGCVGAIDALQATCQAPQLLPPTVSQTSAMSCRMSGASGSSHRAVSGQQSSRRCVRGSRESFVTVCTVKPFDPHACLPTGVLPCGQFMGSYFCGQEYWLQIRSCPGTGVVLRPRLAFH
jgi:hypothetical protein